VGECWPFGVGACKERNVPGCVDGLWCCSTRSDRSFLHYVSVEVLLVEDYARKALEKASTYLTSSPSTDKPTRMYVPLSP